MLKPKVEIEYKYVVCAELYEARITVYIPAYYKKGTACSEPALMPEYTNSRIKLQNAKLYEYWGSWSSASDYRSKSEAIYNANVEELKQEAKQLVKSIAKALADVKANYVALPEKQTIYLED